MVWTLEVSLYLVLAEAWKQYAAFWGQKVESHETVNFQGFVAPRIILSKTQCGQNSLTPIVHCMVAEIECSRHRLRTNP